MRRLARKSIVPVALLVLAQLTAPAAVNAAAVDRTASLTARMTESVARVAAEHRLSVKLRARHDMRVRVRAAVRSDADSGARRAKSVRLPSPGAYRMTLGISGRLAAALDRPGALLRVSVRYRGHGRRGKLVLSSRRGPGAEEPTGEPPVAPPRCPAFGSAVNAGTVDFAAAVELSGLAASRRNPGVLWTHNDSGDTERAFVVDLSAHLIGTYTVSTGAQQDWEDIAVGPGPEAGVNYVYIGSIGGNAGRHALYVYRAPEPSIATGGSPFTAPLPDTVELEMAYPGSEAYDAEALLADSSGDLYVVTKSYAGTAKVFRYPLAAQQTPSTPYSLDLVATLEGVGPVTAGDIAPGGGEVILKSYTSSYLWPRATGTSVASALETEPCAIPHGAGEAIGFAADAGSYFTITEGAGVPLYRFDRSPG